MAIKNKDEIMNSLRERFSEDTSDDVLAFIEDVSDTLSDYETKASDTTDWKEKYEANDREWREKYKERFFSSSVEDDSDFKSESDTKIKTKFEELFG